MTNQERQLVQSALELLHRVIALDDAAKDFKPLLRFAEEDAKVIAFPGKANQPPAERQEADFLKPIPPDGLKPSCEPAQAQKENDDVGTSPKEERGINFTEKEILSMPKKFQKLFRTKLAIAHVRLQKGKYYEIRVMIDGEEISATSKDLDVAKERFIKKLYDPNRRKRGPTFKSFAENWLENVAKPFIKKITYDDYCVTIRNHLIPFFGELRLTAIDSMMLQKFLNEKGGSRQTEKCFTLLGTLFTYATPKYIPYSPMQHVKKPLYLPKEKKPLSKEEEFAFIRYLFETENPYRYHFVVILYTGLRRSELKTAAFDDDFVTVLSAKQRFGHPEILRSIPISPVFRRFLPIGELHNVRDDTLSALFKEINDALGMHHTLHDLRKTFNTRARTCGIPKQLAQHWMGHKPSKDDVNESAYMDYPKEYQLEQIKLFDYEFPDDIFPKIFPKI